MTRIPLILDCDPGVDDGVALLMAFASLDRLDLRGITTVAGNVGLAQTARNARLLRQLAGGAAERVPVLQGCARPMVRDLIVAEHFHGESGLGNLVIFEPAAPLAAGHAVNFIVETLLREPAGTITLTITGPMTNVAMAMRLEPSIVSRIRQVVFMGGARLEAGNVTASAEYNIYADPHAAAVVCGSGVPLVALGLDATHQVRSNVSRRCVAAAADGTRTTRCKASSGSPVSVSAASARCIAQEAPSALNAGRPSRSDSSFTSTRATPSSRARLGASTRRVGR